MALSVDHFAATVPAGTLITSVAVINLPVGAGSIDKIRWRVPSGPRGNLGWFLSMGGARVLPDNAGGFIVADDEYDEWTISGLPDSGAWQLSGYNTGVYDHTVYLDFHFTPIGAVTTGGGDFLTGFPVTDADIPGMWLT